jgi:hypothetical protein
MANANEMADIKYGPVDDLPLMRVQGDHPPEDIAPLPDSRFDESGGYVLERESCVTSRGYNCNVWPISSDSPNLLDIHYQFDTSPPPLARDGPQQTDPVVKLGLAELKQYHLKTSSEPGFPFK